MRTIFNYPFLIELDENGNLLINSGVSNRYLLNHQLDSLKRIIDNTVEFYDTSNFTDAEINRTNLKKYIEGMEIVETCVTEKYYKTKVDKETSIYLAQNTRNYTLKIGRSKNPKNRIANLNTASADKVIMLYSFESVESKEIDLHDKYKLYRLNGEWFQFNQNIIDEFKSLSK
jgi:hypothetical protein